MDARKERGLTIAALCKLTRKGSAWLVPSQTELGRKYTVCPDKDNPHCTCPDHELTGKRCKHIFAVEFVMQREFDFEGNQVETATVTIKETRKTYSQDWPAYNAAQQNEKQHFQELLHDLCQGIEEPSQVMGRPRLSLRDSVFAACFKVYSTVSGRRFATDLKEAQAKGFIGQAPHYNSVFRCLESEALTPILKNLIIESSMPLKTVEVDFACDSSGFATSRFLKWFDHKWGKMKSYHHWLKVHLTCGTKTGIVTAVEVKDEDGADSPFMPDMVRQTAENFTIREWSADKGYSTVENHEVVASVGGQPYIPFKCVATGYSGGLWAKCFHYFSYRREEFLQHYHKRSRAESVFSAIKAKFRDHIRSKSDVAMRNEVLCKVLCYNICCLIQEMYELRIEPEFWQNGSCPKSATPALKVVS
jgi:transposase